VLFYENDAEARGVPFDVNPIIGGFPADRAPPRTAVTGIGRNGHKVVWAPGEGIHDLPVDPPEPIQRGEPRLP
jgi:hypothetical protein